MQKVAAEREVSALAAEPARRSVVQPRDHPSDLDEHEVGERLDVLVGDGETFFDVGDNGGVGRGIRTEVPEGPRIFSPVRVGDLILKDAGCSPWGDWSL